MSKLTDRLAAPFEADEVKWKPQAISGNRAMAVAYVSARAVMDRLDEVVGPDCWRDDYEPLASGSVVCRLSVKLGDEWITKADVGSESEQPDGGDRVKAAFSDALKRAAVKFGIGRYLYRLPLSWVDYDAQKRKFVRLPSLPTWALPKQEPAAMASGVETISEEQGGNLAALLRKCGFTDAAFLFERYAITRLGELPLEHYKDAQAFIMKRAGNGRPAAQKAG